jgi:hypothetical protein
METVALSPFSLDPIVRPIRFASAFKFGVETNTKVTGHANSLLVGRHMKDPSKIGSKDVNISVHGPDAQIQHEE